MAKKGSTVSTSKEVSSITNTARITNTTTITGSQHRKVTTMSKAQKLQALTLPKNVTMNTKNKVYREDPIGDKGATILKGQKHPETEDENGKVIPAKFVQVSQPNQYDLECFAMLTGYTLRCDGVNQAVIANATTNTVVSSGSWGSVRYTINGIGDALGIRFPERPVSTRETAKDKARRQEDEARIKRMEKEGLDAATIKRIMAL